LGLDKDIVIEINGDLEEAKRFNLNETISNGNEKKNKQVKRETVINKKLFR